MKFPNTGYYSPYSFQDLSFIMIPISYMWTPTVNSKFPQNIILHIYVGISLYFSFFEILNFRNKVVSVLNVLLKKRAHLWRYIVFYVVTLILIQKHGLLSSLHGLLNYLVSWYIFNEILNCKTNKQSLQLMHPHDGMGLKNVFVYSIQNK